MRLVLVMLMLSVSLAAAGQDSDDLSALAPSAATPMKVMLQDADVTDVLRFLEIASGIEIQVTPDADEVGPMSLQFSDATFEDIFRFVVQAADLRYTVIDERTLHVSRSQ